MFLAKALSNISSSKFFKSHSIFIFSYEAICLIVVILVAENPLAAIQTAKINTTHNYFTLANGLKFSVIPIWYKNAQSQQLG